MFERRLRVLLILFSAAGVALLARLLQLQLVHGDVYRQRVEDLLRRTPESLPFVRGGILDRRGQPMVTDQPCWSIALDYRVLAYDEESWRTCAAAYALTRRYGAAIPRAHMASAFAAELDDMWGRLARFGGVEGSELRRRRDDIVDRVRRLREAVARRAGYDDEVLEERLPHALIEGLNVEEQVAARAEFRSFPWIHVQPGAIRRHHDTEPAAHLLGTMGPVDADDLERDPRADDPYACFLADERIGKSGAERLLDDRLRGRRGERLRDRQGRVVEDELLTAANGADVRLTLDMDLQRRVYDLMGAVADAHPDVCGGCAVVLDAGSRDILACVSYPAYDPSSYRENFTSLRDDTARLPLVFRAAVTQYAPGSIVKPLVCIAGLAEGKASLDHAEHCAGYLFPDMPNAPASKCWEIEGTGQRMHHGDVDVVGALRGSCNIYMYRLGERLGVDGLTRWFDRFGFGRDTGTGLREEIAGVNPTPAYAAVRGLTQTAGYARAYAIGQGELSITPLQAANLVASYASGEWRPLRLVLDSPQVPSEALPVPPSAWRAIRQGMFEVVNHPSGTAHKYVSFSDDHYVLCGKTGSATAAARPTLYAVPATDREGRQDVFYVPAGSRADALQRFDLSHPNWTPKRDELVVVGTWPRDPPAPPKQLSHAWFAGFLQPSSGHGEPDWSRAARLAFVVLVEFGGSGGRVSGPVASDLARLLMDTLGAELDLDRTIDHAP